MLKTNSKQVKEKIRAYLINTFIDYEEKPAGERTEAQVLEYIAEGIASEKISAKKEERAQRFAAFYSFNVLKVVRDYAQGLGGLFDCDYYLYYQNDPVKLVGDILEQTEEQRAKYSDDQAAELMTLLISRELQPYILKAIY